MTVSELLQATTHTTTGSVGATTATQNDQKESMERNGIESGSVTGNEETVERNITAVDAANVKI